MLIIAVTPALALAGELHVMTSGGFGAAYATLRPGFERASGDSLVTVNGASMGDTPTAIPARLARGEPADVVILAREGLDLLVARGLVVKGSEVDLVRSRVALAVRAGAPVPDISTPDALKRTLLAAKSVGYSDSASGVYVSGELFKRLGIADQMAAKAKKIPGAPVGQAIASGEVEVGFQQLSELKPIPGITVVGPIPDAVQKITVFSAGVAASSKSPAAARALIDYLASPKSAPAIAATGLDPVSGAAR